MVEDIDMGERHGRVLAELAEVGMTMVRRLSEAMLQARDPQTQAQLGLAFHRASRRAPDPGAGVPAGAGGAPTGA